MTDQDLPIAEHAYAVLIEAKAKPREVAADMARELRTATRNTGTRDTETETPYDVWTRAISRTEEWRNMIS